MADPAALTHGGSAMSLAVALVVIVAAIAALILAWRRHRAAGAVPK